MSDEKAGSSTAPPRNDKHGPPFRNQRNQNNATALTTARHVAQDFSQLVGTVTLVPAGLGTGKRGRGAGFYCEACDLTFKDNKQFVEHTNSVQHRQNCGETTKVRRATADEVLARIDEAWERKQAEQKQEGLDLNDRLEERKEQDQKEREERRKRRKELAEKHRLAKQEAEQAKTLYGDDFHVVGEQDEDDMMEALGFTGFGTSKK